MQDEIRTTTRAVVNLPSQYIGPNNKIFFGNREQIRTKRPSIISARPMTSRSSGIIGNDITWTPKIPSRHFIAIQISDKAIIIIDLELQSGNRSEFSRSELEGCPHIQACLVIAHARKIGAQGIGVGPACFISHRAIARWPSQNIKIERAPWNK